MKKRIVVLTLIMFLVSTCVLPVFAEDEEPEYAIAENVYIDQYEILKGNTIDIPTIEPIIENGFVNDENPVWTYEYIAPYDGTYYAHINNLRDNTRVDFEIIDEWNNRKGIFDSDNLEFKEGEKYIFQVSQNHGNTDFTFELDIQEPYVNIQDDTTTIKDQITFPGQQNVYTYTAPMNGTYMFQISCEASNARVQYRLLIDDGSKISSIWPGYNSISYTCTLDKGRTYTLYIVQDSGVGPYSISIGVPQREIEITGYTVIEDKLDFDNAINWYSIVAPIDGIYSFQMETANDINAGFEVYDHNMERIGSSNPYMSSPVTVFFVNDETYFLKVCRSTNSYRDYKLYIDYPIGAQAFLDSFVQNIENAYGDIVNDINGTDDSNSTMEEKPEINLEDLLFRIERLEEIIEDNGLD